MTPSEFIRPMLVAAAAAFAAPGIGGASAPAPSPFAVEVVSATGPFDTAPYDDATAMLGMPATDFHDRWAGAQGGTAIRRVKLVEAAFNLDPTGTRKLLTTLLEGSSVVVRFEEPIRDDPTHPYGIDLLVFGNTFFTAQGAVSEETDMNTLRIGGGAFAEPMKVSVSPGFTGGEGQSPTDPSTWDWYRYEQGPYADSLFPTHAYHWDRAKSAWSTNLMDFTKPVNPALASWFQPGVTSLTVADAIDLYDGSGGGTGFDLAESGFPEVRYVRIEGLPGFDAGEVDALAAVRPMLLGDSLTIAPENLTDGGATLRFGMKDPAGGWVAIRFTAVDGIARVATAPIAGEDLPREWDVMAAAELRMTSLPEPGPIECVADLRWFPGPGYTGDGSDLEALAWSEESGWSPVDGAFDTAAGEYAVPGIPPSGRFALARRAAPVLSITRRDGVELQFAPRPGWRHILERTTDLDQWSEVRSELLSADGPVVWKDGGAADGCVFYRLRLERP